MLQKFKARKQNNVFAGFESVKSIDYLGWLTRLRCDRDRFISLIHPKTLAIFATILAVWKA